ncbi:hypothetical protein AAFF_G00206650 [Aldrovandia affinis]|uniref:Uncharacterized protein n=1 Tax=Aldrovandia affinis TaxID=143900 RepID=A0AAD7RHA6_9TELE|nr:hypothetical protein AAFF_G00206650 [Aldrovandia affinis]
MWSPANCHRRIVASAGETREGWSRPHLIFLSTPVEGAIALTSTVLMHSPPGHTERRCPPAGQRLERGNNS